MTAKRKKIIVFGYYGYRNLGDGEILRMICRDLKKDYDLTVLSRRPKETAAQHGVDSIGRFHLLRILSRIRQADLVIGGGGTLLQDKTSTRSLLYYLSILRAAQHFGVPTMLYAGGIGPIDRPANRRRTAKVLRNVDAITLRDMESAKLLEEICPGKESVPVADPVFRLEGTASDTAARILRENGISGENIFAVAVRRMKKAEAVKLAALLDGIAVREGLVPVFISMQEPVDRRAAGQVRQLMKQPSVLLGECRKGSDLAAILRTTKGIVSMRLHALIFGAAAGIPLVGFDMDPKINAFMESVGSTAVIPWRSYAVEETVEKVAKVFRTGPRPETARGLQLSRKTPEIVRKVLCEARQHPFVVHITSGGDYGGAKTHILSLLRGLMEANCRVLLICFVEGEFSRDAENEGILVRILPRNDVPGNLLWLNRFIERNHVDVVHCHGAKGNMYGALLGRRGIPVLTTVHSDPRLDYLGRPAADHVFGAINRRAIRKMPWCVTVSEKLQDYLLSAGIPRDRVFLLHNAAPDMWKEILTRDAWLKKHGVSTQEDSVVFGAAARFSPVKDLSLLIEAFAGTVKKYPAARLVLAGKGEEEALLKEKARLLCPPDTVVFAGWLTDTESFYHAVDVNVLTSRSEGFPYSVAEGGRAGCATIASRVGEVSRIIRDGEEGLLFESGDLRTLTKHMEMMISEPILRKKLGRALQKRLQEDFSWQDMIRRQVEIYDAIRKQ